MTSDIVFCLAASAPRRMISHVNAAAAAGLKLERHAGAVAEIVAEFGDGATPNGC